MAGIIYCGDNLEVLSEYVPPESVDFVYLDPPFNSKRMYNLTYNDQRAQEQVFKDFWSWEEVAAQLHTLVDSSNMPRNVRTLLRALHDVLIESDSDLLAYLTMMTPRLVAMHHVLKSTGSLYLHCDPTASHYLKAVLDAVFGSRNFRNEVIWKRSYGHGGADKHAPVHDVLLFYSKSDSFRWNPSWKRLPQKTIDQWYNNVEEKTGRRFNRDNLTGSGTRGGESGKTWRGVDVTKKGRHWAIPRSVDVVKEIVGDLGPHDALDALDAAGRIHWPEKHGGVPMFKRYIEEATGIPALDVITNVPHLHNRSPERVGYPTQKPLALLIHVLELSSSQGDLVLDPFCGCGTTVEAAETLGRRWVGIDIARKAVEVIEHRFGKVGLDAPEVVWHPADPASAEALAERDKTQFEAWALRKVRAARLRKKDRGIDGEAIFKDGDGGRYHVLVSVKGGRNLTPAFVRELRGTLEREVTVRPLAS